MSGTMTVKRGVCLWLALFLTVGAVAYAEKMFGVPATVEGIEFKAKTMKLTYADPDTKATKEHEVYWDKATEFIKEGPPPDMKESPAKAEDIKKGSRLYVRITDQGQKGGTLRLDAVRIKP